MGAIYRTMPGGMNGLSTTTRKSSAPVVLEELVHLGSRAQRRWAKRQLAQITATKGKAAGGRA